MDVVFYAPFVGWILSSDSTLPPGGAETQIVRLAKELVKRGASVGIVVYARPDVVPQHLDGVRIITRVPHQSNKRLLGKIVEAIRIWHALWRAPSRAVVYRGAGLELGLIGLYTKVTRRRLVFSSAHVVDFDFRRLVRNTRDLALYHLGIRLADELVVQTEEQVELCESAFERKPVLIKSLVERADQPSEHPEAFLWVGRLVSYKQPLEYLALAREVPEAQFWMVGVPATHDIHGGDLDRRVAAEARNLPNLTLLDPRPQPEIERLMSRAVASVNTADSEGMPNVLLEAWCRGVPGLVLAHDPGGVIVEWEIGGFADGSLERLAALARELWRKRDDRAALSARCREYVASQHAPEVVVTRWARLLNVRCSTLETSDRPAPEKQSSLLSTTGSG